MPISDDSIHWLVTYGTWLPVALVAVLTPILAMLSASPQRVLRRGGYFVLGLALWVAVLGHTPRQYRPALESLPILLVLIAGAVRYYRSTPAERRFGSLAPLMVANRSGDYELVLRLCDGPAVRRLPEAHTDLLRGAALYQLRRFDEAVSLLQNALTKQPAAVSAALIYELLGQILVGRARWDDANRKSSSKGRN